MKFLPVPRLSALCSLLSSVELPDSVVHCRVEAYSTKAAGKDKLVAKKVERAMALDSQRGKTTEGINTQEGEIQNIHSLTQPPSVTPILVPQPSTTSLSSSSSPSPFPSSSSPHPSAVGLSATRRLFVSLITTLNASFPDYDFTHLGVQHFEREHSVHMAMSTVNSTFIDAVRNLEGIYGGVREELWGAVNETLELDNCEVYIFSPDDDEFNEGKLWTLNYFFSNRKSKKILFLSAFAESKLRFNALHKQTQWRQQRGEEGEDFDEFGEDYDYEDYEGGGEDDGGESMISSVSPYISSHPHDAIPQSNSLSLQQRHSSLSNISNSSPPLSSSHPPSSPHSPSLSPLDRRPSQSEGEGEGGEGAVIESQLHSISIGVGGMGPKGNVSLELDWDENDPQVFQHSMDNAVNTSNSMSNNQSLSGDEKTPNASQSATSHKRTKASTDKIHTKHPDRKASRVDQHDKEKEKEKSEKKKKDGNTPMGGTDE